MVAWIGCAPADDLVSCVAVFTKTQWIPIGTESWMFSASVHRLMYVKYSCSEGNYCIRMVVIVFEDQESYMARLRVQSRECLLCQWLD